MHQTPKVALIVLNHNSVSKLGREMLRYVESIAKTQYRNLEIIIIDNASTDGSYNIIQDWVKNYPHTRLLKLDRNLGYAGGNNTGFRTAVKDAKYVAFLNNDIEVEQDWLEKIIEVMESDRSIAAAQPKILQLKNKQLIDSLGGFVDRLGRAYDLGHGMPDMDQHEKPFEVFYARGAAIVVRAELFRMVGGFDEDYFIYYEETDLCWRLRLLGYKIVTVPTARIYHLGGGTTGGATPHTIYLRRRNQLATILKNYNLFNAMRFGATVILLYSVFAISRLTIRRDSRVAAAVLKSLIWNIKNLKRVFAKRAIIQAIRRVPEKDILKHMLTVQQYNSIAKHLVKEY
jgi:hypothetical protein